MKKEKESRSIKGLVLSFVFCFMVMVSGLGSCVLGTDGSLLNTVTSFFGKINQETKVILVIAGIFLLFFLCMVLAISLYRATKNDEDDEEDFEESYQHNIFAEIAKKKQGTNQEVVRAVEEQVDEEVPLQQQVKLEQNQEEVTQGKTMQAKEEPVVENIEETIANLDRDQAIDMFFQAQEDMVKEKKKSGKGKHF